MLDLDSVVIENCGESVAGWYWYENLIDVADGTDDIYIADNNDESGLR